MGGWRGPAPFSPSVLKLIRRERRLTCETSGIWKRGAVISGSFHQWCLGGGQQDPKQGNSGEHPWVALSMYGGVRLKTR